MKKGLYWKYPRFLALAGSLILAYVLFAGLETQPHTERLKSLEYLGMYVVGIFYSYGFTGPPAAAALLIIGKDLNIALAGIVAGLGAMTGDLILFRLIRHSFVAEMQRLRHERIFRFFLERIPLPLKKHASHLLPIIGCLVIASPLPDEIGIVLIASSNKISTEVFSILCYFLNTGGIMILLALGRLT